MSSYKQLTSEQRWLLKSLPLKQVLVLGGKVVKGADPLNTKNLPNYHSS